MNGSIPPALLILPLLAPVGFGSDTLPFPLVPTGERDSYGAIELQPAPLEILALRDHQRVTLLGAPSTQGPVDLELTRVHLGPRGDVYVDGELSEDGLDLGDLSIWKGSVLGHEQSDVLLGLSLHGCHGWIDLGDERLELLSAPGLGNDWRRFTSRLVPAEVISMIGPNSGPVCATDTSSLSAHVLSASGGSVNAPSWSGGTLDCPVAIETDYQLYQTFGSLAAVQNYTTLLITAVSDRFREQIDVVLTYPYVAFYTNPNDPWTSQDTPGAGCGEVLTEFRNAWAGNIPNGGKLGHFISGAHLGCGVAWLGVVCNQSYGFSLSCCINGGVTFPVQQGSNTWDFFVMAHELGHNFNSPHTHSFCPPLDECSTNCNNNIQCTNQGTNMSYCHGCPGGMNNITTYFHPVVEGVMREHAENSCIGSYCQNLISYCTTAPNSAGAGALMAWGGSGSLASNDLILVATGCPPNQFGLFYTGPDQASTPMGDGYLCVGGALTRFPALQVDWMGVAELALDHDSLPPGLTIQAGELWNYSFWFRDPAFGGAGFNFADGLEVTFCP